jgi:hypothetical protein
MAPQELAQTYSYKVIFFWRGGANFAVYTRLTVKLLLVLAGTAILGSESQDS